MVVGVSGHSAVAVSARADPVAQVVAVFREWRRRAGIIDVIETSPRVGMLGDLSAAGISQRAGAPRYIIDVGYGPAVLHRLRHAIGAIIGESNQPVTVPGG